MSSMRLLRNVQLRISTRDGDNHYEMGMKIQKENIIESINEWELIDSTGFCHSPP